VQSARQLGLFFAVSGYTVYYSIQYTIQ